MNVTFIGGGNMASAMIGGLLAAKDPGLAPLAIRVIEIDSGARQRLTERFGVICFEQVESRALTDSDVVVLAIKPQQMRAVAVQLGPLLGGQIVLSIAAGIRLKDLLRWLGTQNCVLVRAMPNTPALAGAGISGLYAARAASAADRRAAERILGAVGAILWLEREEDLDAITAVSGSGPAYVFYFIEALEQAAQELGLPADAARKLALETFAGAVKLATQGAEPPAMLRGRVTSKGGTTERALKSLEADHVKEAIVRAVRAAAGRSRELGDELGKD